MRSAAADPIPQAITPSLRLNGISRKRRMATTDNELQSGRRLNLHQYKRNETANVDFFNPMTVYETSVLRARFFDTVFSRLNTRNQIALLGLEERLRPFGYSLHRGRHYPYRCEPSVFADWELIKYPLVQRAHV